MKTVIIIPTYNEAENIGRLIDVLEVIFKEKVSKKWDMHILVVDDSSPDGTSDVVKKYMKKFKNVHLFLNKEKIGLGGAYMKGMRYAIDDLKAELMFEMDADFQHDENLIPTFLEKIDQGADVVIGSRYMAGGSIPQYWGLSRKILSVGGNIYIRLLMLDRNVHDWTTGFRAIKPWVYEKVKDKITELKTYSFQISFLYFARKEGAKVSEVPLNFRERKRGKSKMPGVEGMIKTFVFITRVRIFDFIKSRFFKFGIVGFIGFVLQTAVFEVLGVFLKITSPSTAGVLGGELAIISNFTLNNLWTFKEAKVTGIKVIYKFIQFNLSSLIALAIQFVILRIGEVVSGGSKLIIQLFYLGAIFIVLIVNYIIYNIFIWKTWKIPGLSRIQKLLG